jgi:hypothetical protein
VILVGLALVGLRQMGGAWPARRARLVVVAVPLGMAAYYAGGLGFSVAEADRVAAGSSFGDAVRSLEPWQSLVLVPAAVAVLAGFFAFARAAWQLTERQRAEGRQAIVAAPGLYTGKIPKRVRRRSPAALAGYELPLGLMGFPGVGWLFAGFPFTASILLTAGPALAWAVIPVAFSPYGQGPLRDLGWEIELAWLPASALVSSAALYRAHARRRALLDGPRPPRGGRRSRTLASYRARVGLAAGALALLLVSLPFLPAVAGIGSSNVRYSYEPRFTRDVTGQFLVTRRGPVKLFSWRDPQGSYPADALRLRSADVRSLLVRAPQVDAPDAYRLYDLVRGGSVPLTIARRSPTTLSLTPARRLDPGRYAFVASHEGMFGGRDYDYLTVVRPGEPVTPISTSSRTSSPAVADALLPLAAALVALLFAARLGSSALRRPAAQKWLWALGFAFFAVAAAAEALAHRGGWNVPLFRAYYLAGGVLAVAYLGAGSAWLLLPRRARDVMLGGLAIASAAAATAVALAPVDAATVAAAPSGRPPANSALGGHAFLWAVGLNSFGTLFLVGGSLYAIARRRRVWTNVWIGGGALVVALATGLSRTGTYSLVYAGELLGIVLMFYGFTWAGQAQRASVTFASPSGRSGSRPFALASAHAKSWPGTTE